MTIIEAINQIDAFKHNTYSQSEKTGWLSKLDGMVQKLILDTHRHGSGSAFAGYDGNTPVDTVLLIGAPFEQVYLRWLEAQIDYHNGEYGRYNNAISLFNTEYAAFADHYHRTHKPADTLNRFY